MERNNDEDWTTDAIQRGDLDAIHQRVRGDGDYLESRDSSGDTPLLIAIDDAELDLVKFLLEHGADPNVAVDDGYTCLLTAIESDFEDSIGIVAALIAAGANLHQTGTCGWSPLHMAAIRGRTEKARLLIDAGAQVNQRKEIDAQETPLMESAFVGRPEIVQLLLDNGADPMMRDTINNRTPREIAQNVVDGPDPSVFHALKGFGAVDFGLAFDYDDMGLPPVQLARLRHLMAHFDVAKTYVSNMQKLAVSGDHAEVIRILTNC